MEGKQSNERDELNSSRPDNSSSLECYRDPYSDRIENRQLATVCTSFAHRSHKTPAASISVLRHKHAATAISQNATYATLSSTKLKEKERLCSYF